MTLTLTNPACAVRSIVIDSIDESVALLERREPRHERVEGRAFELHAYSGDARRLGTAQRVAETGFVADAIDQYNRRFARISPQLRCAVAHLLGVEAHPFQILAPVRGSVPRHPKRPTAVAGVCPAPRTKTASVTAPISNTRRSRSV